MTPAIVYEGPDGERVTLPIPDDWKTQEAAGRVYVLGIVAGLPAWVIQPRLMWRGTVDTP